MFRYWVDTEHCFDMCKDCDSLSRRCRVDRVWRIGHHPNPQHNHNALSTGDTCSNNSSPLYKISELNMNIYYFILYSKKNQIKNVFLMINRLPYASNQVDLAYQEFLSSTSYQSMWPSCLPIFKHFQSWWVNLRFCQNKLENVGYIIFLLLEG